MSGTATRNLARALAMAMALAVAAGGCARQPAAPEGPGQWYTLRGGSLVAGAPGTGPAPAESRVWTQQVRIADLLIHDGVLYLGVNGLGLATAPFPGEGGFTARFDPDLFGGRTITELYPDRDGLLVHLYLNRTLAEADTSPRSETAPAFLRVGWKEAGPDHLTPPWQAANRGWEPVAVVRTGPGAYAIEWKRTDDERTEFHYTTFDTTSGAEGATDRERFRAAFAFHPHAADPATEALFQAVIRTARSGVSRPTAVHFVIRSDGDTERLRYQPPGYTDEPDVDLAVIPGRRVGQAVWALLPGGELLSVAGGGERVVSQALPRLPAGYRYTGFDAAASPDGVRVAAAWEETRFTTVGEAGLHIATVRAP